MALSLFDWKELKSKANRIKKILKLKPKMNLLICKYIWHVSIVWIISGTGIMEFARIPKQIYWNIIRIANRLIIQFPWLKPYGKYIIFAGPVYTVLVLSHWYSALSGQGGHRGYRSSVGFTHGYSMFCPFRAVSGSGHSWSVGCTHGYWDSTLSGKYNSVRACHGISLWLR